MSVIVVLAVEIYDCCMIFVKNVGYHVGFE